MTLKRIFVAQLLALCLVLGILFVLSPSDVRSSLFGSGISIAGNGYAAWRVFERTKGKSAKGELPNLYRAEFGKLAIIGVLCAAVFAGVDDIRIGGFLMGLFSGMVAATIAVVTEKIRIPDQGKIKD